MKARPNEVSVEEMMAQVANDKPDYLDKRFTIDADTYQNFIIVKPLEYPSDGVFDPWLDAVRIANFPWRETYGAAGICYDTGSECWYQVQRFVSNEKSKEADAPVYGDPDGRETGEMFRATRFTDYQDGQGLTLSLMKTWAKCAQRQDLHLWVIGHRAAVQEKIGKGKNATTQLVGYGMDMPGSKHTLTTTKFFEEYVYFTNQGVMEPEIRLHLKPDQYHIAKFRSMNLEVPAWMDLPFDEEELYEIWRKLAGWRGINYEDPRGRKFCMAAYGDGGMAKTATITSQPPEFYAQGPMVYVAYDPASHQMSSTWPGIAKLKEKK